MQDEPETPETEPESESTPPPPSSPRSEREPAAPHGSPHNPASHEHLTSLRADLEAVSSNAARMMEQTQQALDLQFTRLDQFAGLLKTDRQQVLDTLDEMKATMELQQQFLARQDETISRLEEAVAGLIKTALLLSQDSESEMEEEE